MKKIPYFFTCILPNYVPHEITKIFWKNSQFENMIAGFLLRWQNSLRWEICLISHCIIDSWKQNLSFGYVMVQKRNQKKHLDATKTTFSKDITIRGAILVKMKNVIPENASFQGYFTEMNFHTSEGNQLSYFQNDYFLKILCWSHEAHNWAKCS